MKFEFKKLISLIFLGVAFYTNAQQVEVITGDEERTGYSGKSYLVVKSLRLKPPFTFKATASATFYAKVHSNLVQPVAPSSDRNFLREEIVLQSGVQTEDQLRTLPATQKRTAYNYLDGDGKGIQLVKVGVTPQHKDLVQPTLYDALGRASREFLPYSAASAAGGYRSGYTSEQSTFYGNATDKVADDSRPYTDITYDNSPVGKVKNATAPGSAWSAKPVVSSYKIHYQPGLSPPIEPGSDQEPVRIWNIVGGLPQSTNVFQTGSLLVSQAADEQGNISRTYSDFLGRTIMKEVQTSGGDWARTYYVYNPHGNLQFTIPPAAIYTLTPDATFADRWYMQYEYDEFQRQTGVKMPGVGWVYTIYDQWDRPVLTQDARQRSKSPQEWTFVKYDEFNRVAATGIWKSGDSRSVITTSVGNSSGRYETRIPATAVGYTLNQTFPTGAIETDLLSINYYDDYSVLTNPDWEKEGNSFSFVPESGFPAAYFTSLKNLPTASKVKIIHANDQWVTSNKWLNSVLYYDSHYRVIQAISEHHLGGVDRHTKLVENFNGRVLKTLHVHLKTSVAPVTILKTFGYDDAGRIVKTWHKINSQPEVVLSAQEYNELGQPVDKKLHSADQEASWLQSVDYRYGIRGWVTNINKTTAESGDPDDYFGIEYGYENSLGSGNAARYDGLVSGAKWKNDLSAKERAYNYSYDKGSLTAGSYKTINGVNPQTDVYTENNISYDINGNIQSLNRYAGTVASAAVDQLTYNYGAGLGNQLMKVTDNTSNVKGFKDGNTSGDDYTYDENGNLTRDKNKLILSITYNTLDLVDKVTLENNAGYVLYTYDASGKKLTQAFYNNTNVLQKGIDYVGSFLYFSDQVDNTPKLGVINHTEGRLVTGSSANLISNMATREGNTLEGFTANGSTTLTRETVNGETYVKAVCGQNGGSPGIFPVGGAIAVKPGEGYSFKVLGYQSTGTNATVYIWGNNGDLLWPGVTLPSGLASESWVTGSVTIPAGVSQIKVGVLWNGGGSGNTFRINKVALYKTDWEYQYFISDHQENTRAVLQSAPGVYTFTATMESENFASESAQFFNLNSARELVLTGTNATPGGTKALKMDSQYQIGPSRSFMVMPGDRIDANVMAFYPSGGTFSKTPLGTMATLLMTALTSTAPSMVDGAGTSYNSSGGSNPDFLLSPQQTGKPSAFLNYILFDETYTPIEAKSQPVGAADVLHPVTLPTISIKQPGYLLVYLSYDNQIGAPDVWFDDLKITYQESAVIQLTDYYPYGMSSFNWVREGENENKYLYQGQELNTHTGWIEFGSRVYYQDLGRWFAADPQSQFASPYMAMGNIPMMGVDPNGEFWNIVIGAVIGGVSSYISGRSAGLRGWDLAGFTFAGAAIGAISAGVGSAVSSSVTAATSSSLAGAAAGGIAGGFVGGFYGSAFSGGDPLRGGLYGAAAGLAGGLVGANFSGGKGALLAGAAAGMTNAALNGGDIFQGAIVGAGIGFASYHAVALATFSRKTGTTFDRLSIRDKYRYSKAVQETLLTNKEHASNIYGDGSQSELIISQGECRDVGKYVKGEFRHPVTGEIKTKMWMVVGEVFYDMVDPSPIWNESVIVDMHTHLGFGTTDFSTVFDGDIAYFESKNIPHAFMANGSEIHYWSKATGGVLVGQTNQYLMRNIFGY